MGLLIADDFHYSLYVRRIEQVVEGVTGTASHKRAAVEVFQPSGGSFRYGLLGAEFSPDLTGRLVVAVPMESPNTSRVYAEPLSGKLDQVVIGGTPQYAAAVVGGIQNMQRDALPSGCLTFSSIAHGMVGSSPSVFEMLAKAVIRLLARDGQPRTPDEAAALCILGDHTIADALSAGSA